MVTKVIKRTGEIRDFDIGKIHTAIEKAFLDVRKTKPEPWFRKNVEDYFSRLHEETISIEQIQDKVEELLMGAGFYDVARSYILYRSEHADVRLLKERQEYIDKYILSGENASTSSETDANANVSVKNVANLYGELWKTNNRKINRLDMRRWIKKIYGEKYPGLDRQYVEDLEHHILYAHDESNTAVGTNYCQAVSMWDFAVHGTTSLDGGGHSAPHNLSSFAGQFGNLVFLLSSQIKGACAYGEFFNFMDHYIAKDFGEDYHLRENEIAWLFPKKTIKEVIIQYFQQITHTINQPAGNRGYQSPFTNFSYYDSNYWHAIFADFVFPDGTRPSWERVSYLQKMYMRWFNKERTKTLLTFPVETMALLSDGKDIIDKEYKEFTAEMYAEGHSFFTYISSNPDSLASCCRLRNEIQENTFSFTNGLTGVQTGSANVITLNMNRIIQDWAKKEGVDREFLKNRFFDVSDLFVAYMEDILERVYCYQTAYKERLYNLERHGMLTASNAGYISMDKLYSTIGVNGVNEAAEFVGLQCRYNEPYKRFCRLVTGTISRQNKLHSKKGFLFNQEFVPAESLSSKNYNWDKEDGYWVPEDRVLYNSYFYLADDPETSVLEKFRLHGREFTELLDGGVGLHCNLAEHLSKDQYLKLIDFAIANGTSYFTFNVPNSRCSNPDCNYIVKKPLDVCPKCGAPMDQYTRIIGYLRNVKDFDAFRQVEAHRRYYAQGKEVMPENKS